MEYLEFELRLARSGAGSYAVNVVGSPAGESGASFHLELSDPELLGRLKFLELIRGDSIRGADPSLRSSESRAETPATIARQVGERLFAVLMEDRAVFGCYTTSLAKAHEQKKGLRLRLRIEPPELAVLPWEYLFDPR